MRRNQQEGTGTARDATTAQNEMKTGKFFAVSVCAGYQKNQIVLEKTLRKDTREIYCLLVPIISFFIAQFISVAIFNFPKSGSTDSLFI